MKANHGNKSVIIETNHAMSEIDDITGVIQVERNKREIRALIEDEVIAEEIYNIVVQYGFVKRFQVIEPTLNEIFIDKVGDANG